MQILLESFSLTCSGVSEVLASGLLCDIYFGNADNLLNLGVFQFSRSSGFQLYEFLTSDRLIRIKGARENDLANNRIYALTMCFIVVLF